MTEVKTVPITRETIVDTTRGVPLGPIFLSLPEGDALCHDGISLTSLTAEDDDGKFIVIIAVADFGGRHFGSLTRLSAEQARQFGASLIASADEIGPAERVN